MRKTLLLIFSMVISFGIATKAFALTVSPAKVEVRVNPGQSAKGEIEVFNEQNESKVYYTSFENFESRGDSGAPYFIGANGGLATWFDVQNEVSLDKGERRKIEYTINVPKDATPGGYFAAIFFSSEKPKNGQNGEVSIGGKIGILFLLRVNGEIKESAGLSSFGTLNKQRFYSSKPIDFEYSLNNTGGDRVVPKGELVVKNIFGMKTATLLANDKEGSVLPQSTRKFNVRFGPTENISDYGFFTSVKRELNDFNFGWYTAVLNISWGESVQTATNTYNFFIIPWHLLLVVVVVLLVLKVLLNVYKQSVISSVKNSVKK